MIYYDAQNEAIVNGLNYLKQEAEAEDASQYAIAYYEFMNAISRGKGFDYLCDEQNSYWLTQHDTRTILKELLYAIETERITDRHTHKYIVDATLESILDIYL